MLGENQLWPLHLHCVQRTKFLTTVHPLWSDGGALERGCFKWEEETSGGLFCAENHRASPVCARDPCGRGQCICYGSVGPFQYKQTIMVWQICLSVHSCWRYSWMIQLGYQRWRCRLSLSPSPPQASSTWNPRPLWPWLEAILWAPASNHGLTST